MYQANPILMRAVDALAKQQNVKILELRESLLPNWARWWRLENAAVIDNATGKKRVSISGLLMVFAPASRDKKNQTGYYRECIAPPDAPKALATHQLINKLDVLQREAIYEHYVYERSGAYSDAERQRFSRALKQLADLMPDY